MDNVELKKWLDSKIRHYKKDKRNCLEEMLDETNDVIIQFINSPNSKAAIELLKSCMESNNAFIDKIQDL